MDACIYDPFDQCFYECEGCPQYRCDGEDNDEYYPYDTWEEAYD
ncbi:MAG: hypothetical protein ACI4J6_12815 [Oscillospiraceae bacterium]